MIMTFTSDYRCDILSIMAAVLLLSFVVAAICRRHRVSQTAFLLVLGIFFSSAVLFFPYYYFFDGDKAPGSGSLVRALSYAVRSGLKTISGGLDIAMVDDVVAVVGPFESRLSEVLYRAMLYIYAGLAPLLTSGFLVSFIGDFAERFRYMASFKRKYHVFSQLNDESLNIAKRVREQNPGDAIVFCEAKDENEALAVSAKEIYAIILRSSCDGIRIHFWKKNLEFYLVSDDSDTNVHLAENLISIHRDSAGRTVVINAFVESSTAIQVVETMDKGKIGMRFIDRTSLVCNQLLLQEPLYDLPEGRQLASVMIVGCGKIGMRMLKTAAWCGQSLKYGLKIRVYDKNADYIAGEYRAQCPELADSCDIGFVSCDVDTDDVERLVLDEKCGSPEATYVLVAMHDDERNIDVAERLYRLFRNHNDYGYTPKILVRVRSSVKADIYRAENKYLSERNIRLLGGTNGVFEHRTLFHSQLERLSFAVELCYNNLLPEKDPYSMSRKELKNYLTNPKIMECRNRFMHSEYMRRSSMAAAVHIPTKLHDCGVIAVGDNCFDNDVALKFEKRLSEDAGLLDSLACLEHSRWLVYMQSDGYRKADWEELLLFYPKLEDKNTQDKLSRHHLCMVGWEELEELNEKYMSLKPPHEKDFKASDRNIVNRIPQIIRLTNRLEETDLDFLVYP